MSILKNGKKDQERVLVTMYGFIPGLLGFHISIMKVYVN